MRLATNLNSLNIYRNQKNNLKTNSTSLNKISSGKRVISAKDDPNKIGQSTVMEIKIRSLEVANKNLQDSSSMIQSVDGSIGAISDMLIRMKELTVKGLNETNSPEDVETIQKEIDSLKDGIDSIVNGSSFNGRNLIGDKEIEDTSSSKRMTIMSGAESGEKIEMKIYNFSTEALKDSKGMAIRDIDISNNEKKGEFLNTIDECLSFVNGARGEYGAIQIRLENSAECLSDTINLNERAVSKIVDADIAEEMVEFSRTSMLSDASMNLMAQSNKLPKEILSILERIK
ncbi:MAG: flagellin [Clostridium sp.]